MSIRNRNALGLFRLISASYAMLPPSNRPVERHPWGDVRRYRRACVSLEADARCAVAEGGPAARGSDAFATRCRAAAAEETWRCVDNEAIRPRAPRFCRGTRRERVGGAGRPFSGTSTGESAIVRAM